MMPSMISSGPASAGELDSGSRGLSAPVLEFVCLFTRDLQRKQKRWEDGRLKYHTFNKRVMVYDERGHFVGDMHWRRDYEFDEGEEIKLERGVIVQVVECVGRQEQDLSELLDKRAKEKEQRQARVAIRPSLSTASPHTPLPGARVHDHFQTRHRPLHHVLGTPTGHHGRAVVPSESPFELRQRINENPSDPTETRPAKRRKCDITPPTKKGYAQNLFGATLTLSAVPASSAPPRPSTGPALRAQPEPSPPREEPMSDVSLMRRDDRGFTAGNSLHTASLREVTVASASRTLQKPAQSAFLENQGPREPSSVAMARRSLEKPIPNPRESIRRSADSGNHLPTSNGNDTPPSVAAGLATASVRSEIGTAKRNPQPTAVAKRKQADTNVQATVVSKPGTSNSQAIVLDEDDRHNLREDDYFPKEQQQRPVSKRDTPSAGKQKPTKSQRKVRPAKQPPVPEARASAICPEEVGDTEKEERTELRLKPRQKRGLLLLSEKKTARKKPKQQDALTRHLNPVGSFPKQPPPAAAAEPTPALAIAPETVGPYAKPPHDGPFASFPDESGSPKACLGFPSMQSNDCQAVQQAVELDSDNAGSVPCLATTTPRDGGAEPLEQPESPNPANNRIGSARDVGSSPSPRGSRVGSRRKGSARIRRELAETSDPDAEDISAGVGTLEPILPRPSRQTRNTKNADDHGSGRPEKKEREEDSEDDDRDELSRPPVRPHLTRLSRSVRSREVIGFMPSSSPVAEIAHPIQPALAALEEAVEVTCVASPTSNELSAPEEPEGSTGEPQLASLPINLSRAVPPVLQRHNSLPNGGAGGPRSKDSRDEQAAASRVSPSHEPPPRRGLVRHTSAVLPQGGRMNSHPTQARSIPGLERIAAPEKEVAPTTTATRPSSPSRNRTLAANSITLPSPLHNDSSNLSEQPDHPMNDTADIDIVPGVTEGANNQPPDAPAPGPARPRIANPATRGRKAALKSDAAGQVPQSILPVEPVPVRVVGMRPAVMPRPDPPANERPKRTMRFPGFTSVKEGGPWSREAHDLLGSGRPV